MAVLRTTVLSQYSLHTIPAQLVLVLGSSSYTATVQIHNYLLHIHTYTAIHMYIHTKLYQQLLQCSQQYIIQYYQYACRRYRQSRVLHYDVRLQLATSSAVVLALACTSSININSGSSRYKLLTGIVIINHQHTYSYQYYILPRFDFSLFLAS